MVLDLALAQESSSVRSLVQRCAKSRSGQKAIDPDIDHKKPPMRKGAARRMVELSKKQPKAPTVYVIAGPNGAGKTTFASQFLPDFVKCREFLNADLIASGLSPFAPESQNWLPSADMALERVQNRVRQGGHDVPAADIKRRYAVGLRNLFGLYRPALDAWRLYDASHLPPKLIASEEHGRVIVKNQRLFRQVQKQSGKIA